MQQGINEFLPRSGFITPSPRSKERDFASIFNY
jgi:hypothetical protein